MDENINNYSNYATSNNDLLNNNNLYSYGLFNSSAAPSVSEKIVNNSSGLSDNNNTNNPTQAIVDQSISPKYNGDGMQISDSGVSSATGYYSSLTPDQNISNANWSGQNDNYGMGSMSGQFSVPGFTNGTPSSLDNLQNAQANNLNALASDRNIQMWGGGIGGAAQLGLGILKYMDESKNNSMNRKVMQQQINTNNQLMADRTQRNADISKAFGSNGVMSKATGV
jgi:hypothetical protein